MLKNISKLVFTLLFLGIILANNTVVLASSMPNHDLLARITLDPNLKPENSPGVIIGADAISKSGAEASFGNYLLQMLAGGLITVAAPVAIIIIAISGLIAVVSHGDQGLIDKARKTLTWAIIGLLVIIFSWVIVRTTISIVISTNQSQTSGQNSNPPASTPGSEGGSGSEAPVPNSTP